MGRIAENDPGYTFKLCRPVDRKGASLGEKLSAAAGRGPRHWIPTEHGFEMPSVSTFLGEVMGKPASAMAWWGYRIGLDKIAELLGTDPVELIDLAGDPEALEAFLKERGVNPNMKTEEAGDRGSKAHFIGELLAAEAVTEAYAEGEATFRMVAEAYAEDEERTAGTRYGWAAITWWDEQIQPHLDSGEITHVVSEQPLWYLPTWETRFSGTPDLALKWAGDQPGWSMPPEGGWEIVDYKTHKPAAGFTKDGKGPGYIGDVAQIRAYRMGWEWMGRGPTVGQRVVILRDREYKGKCWLEDTREVPESFVLRIREAYDVKTEFEKGAVDG